MERFCLAVLLSVCATLVCPSLADWQLLGATLIICALASAFLPSSWSVCSALMTAILLFPTVLSYQVTQQARAYQAMPMSELRLTGTITGIPRRTELGWQFYFQLQSVSEQAAVALQHPLLELRWYQPIRYDNGDDAVEIQLPELKEGQRWQFDLALKPLASVANPGQGWREANGWVHGVLWTGSVRYQQNTAQAQLLENNASIRQQLADAMASCCQQYQNYPLWLALTLGERPFSDDLWQGLRNTGLNHILSISGMHIGMLFQWCLLFGGLFRLLPLSQAQRMTLLWISAALLALGYSYVAGFAIPTQRAVWSLFVMTALMILRRRASFASQHLLLTTVMLLSWPALMVSVSFWFTVTALTVLVVLQWCLPAKTGLKQAIQSFFIAQLVFTVALLPLSLLIFQGLAPWALLINLVMVPYIALVLFPLLLLCCAFLLMFSQASWLALCWQMLDQLYSPLWWLLHHVDGWISFALLSPVDVGLIAGLLLICIKRSFFLRLASIAGIYLLLANAQATSQHAVHIIDVGQGSAMLLQDGAHGALLDIGPAMGSWSATKQTLLPYLSFYGIHQLDWLLLSHNDTDHTGNLAVLLERWPTLQIYADFGAQVKPCKDLPSAWRGFQLQVLSSGTKHSNDNDNSCVVKVQQGSFTLLNPGDLGHAEAALLAQGVPVASQVLLLGHHGSQSSSSIGWLQQVKPALAVASAGRLNRFGHPSVSVQQRLSLLQIPLISTAEQGAIRFYPSQQQWLYQSYRDSRAPAWLEKLQSDAVSRYRNR